MIEEPPILTINADRRRPTAEQIAAFQGVPTGFVVDAMEGAGALSMAIGPVGDGRDYPCVAAGPALTADNTPGDMLATFAALHFVAAGDIVVAATAGFQGCAAGGDRLAGMIKNGGGAGYVTDGPVRDYQGIVEVALPIWCTGLTPASPFTTGPGRVGFEMVIGGQSVATGDMVIADRDGVVIVPFAQIDAVIERLKAVAENEKRLDGEVAAGRKEFDHVATMLKGPATRYIS
ncbi:MAG: RraA family protein [Pseudomonadota bacterium]